MRRDPHCNYISSIVNELKQKNGDKKIHFVKVDVRFNEKRDFGCEKHPNRFGHKKLADFLEPIIRKELGWESLLKKIIPSNPFKKK
jgi:thiol-disulfide isomerase/thioredoxin